MWSNRAIKKVFRETEVDLKNLWNTLPFFKGQISDQKTAAVFDFQYRLGWRLRKLQEVYNSVKMEEDDLIKRKEHLNNDWFIKRIRRLNQYKHALKQVSYLGRTLGDVFAYNFYRNEPQFLESQMQHEEISSFPIGDGGLGELAFISTNKHYASHFTVYHSITNILRKGDVSFFNLKDGSLSGIGEIKTSRKSDTELTISLTTIGQIDKAPEINTDVFPPPKEPVVYERKSDLFNSPRAQRQLESIKKAFDPKPNELKSRNINENYHFDSLAKIISKTPRGKFEFIKVDDGLGFVCYKSRHRSLYGRFVEKPRPDVDFDLSKQISEIIIQGNKYNQLIFGSFMFDKKGKPQISLGYSPFFYSKIPLRCLKSLYLSEVAVLTVYNPAHMLKGLLGLGFELVDKKKSLEFVYKKGKMKMTFPSWSIRLFIDRIINHCHSQSGILDTIKQVIEYPISPGENTIGRINIAIHQILSGRKERTKHGRKRIR